ncbi:MAG: hypothetical protein U5K37_00445 [Natrialbaceae archaeon]|nr:hypothetical protein [Natrialbaceae archaeon]
MRPPSLALAIAVIALIASTGVAGVGGEVAPQNETEDLFDPADPQLVIQLGLDDTGAVHWTFEHRFVLEPGEEAAFRAYGEAVRNGEREIDYSPGMFATYLADSESATGREMAIERAGWDDVRIEQPDDDGTAVGTLSYSFTWENFARVDQQRIVLRRRLRCLVRHVVRIPRRRPTTRHRATGWVCSSRTHRRERKTVPWSGVGLTSSMRTNWTLPSSERGPFSDLIRRSWWDLPS